MTAQELTIAKTKLIYGPAYRADEAPFPEALQVAPLVPFPAPRHPRRQIKTSTARRPRQSFVLRLAAMLSL